MANYTVFGGRKQHIIRKHNERKNLDAELADRCIFYCDICMRCWEKTKARWNRKIEYYDNFVTYGKQRKICKECASDKSASNKNGQTFESVGLVDATMSGVK